MGREGYTKLSVADSELAEAATEKPLGFLSTQRRKIHALIYLLLLTSNALCLSLWWKTGHTDCIRPQLTYCMSDPETRWWRGTGLKVGKRLLNTRFDTKRSGFGEI